MKTKTKKNPPSSDNPWGLTDAELVAAELGGISRTLYDLVSVTNCIAANTRDLGHDSDTGRIADALERIADALEARK